MVEKPKEDAKAGVQLKPTPAKQKPDEEKKEGYKLKPVPQKPKPEEVGSVAQFLTCLSKYSSPSVLFCKVLSMI